LIGNAYFTIIVIGIINMYSTPFITSMDIKKIIIIIAIAVFLVFSGIAVFLIISGKKEASNASSSQVGSGNISGNLANGGLFCEYDGLVYFANPSDGGKLYSMLPDETKVKKVSNVVVSSLNVDKERVYYTLSDNAQGSGLGYIRKASGLYSIKKNDSGTVTYTQDPVGIAALYGDKLYYQHYLKDVGTVLDCITTKKKNNHTIIESMISPATIVDGTMYYNSIEDTMHLFALDLNSEDSIMIYSHNMYSPIMYNGYIYYMDLETNYEIHRYSPFSGEDIVITRDRVDNFNVAGNYVYYQKNSAADDAGIYRVSADGGDIPVLMLNGIFCEINVTSQYVYFHKYNSFVPMYHVPVNGGGVLVFEP